MAQEPTERAALLGDFEALLTHRDPAVRGEAALALARSGESAYHSRILAVARDPAPAARLRGILALGYLGSPGAESFLGDVLRRAPRAGPDRAIAALALGLMPDDLAAPEFFAYLRRVRGGSYRHNRGPLAALLFGVLQHRHPAEVPAILDILQDAANKQPSLLHLAIRVVCRKPGALPQEDVNRLLGSEIAAERLGILEAMATHDVRPTRDQIEQVEHIAQRDRNPAVRTAALRLLTAVRDLAGLELGVHALRSRDPAEVAAGVRAAIRLGGGAIREAIERRILGSHRPAVQQAMLAAFGSSGSKSFVEQCLRLASDRRTPFGVRVQAAALAGRTGEARAVVALRNLFRKATDADQLATLAGTLIRLAPGRPLGEKVYPATTAGDLRLLPARVQALIAAGWPGALDILHRALAAGRLARDTQVKLLRAYRLGLGRPVGRELLGLLPDGVAELLR